MLLRRIEAALPFAVIRAIARSNCRSISLVRLSAQRIFALAFRYMIVRIIKPLTVARSPEPWCRWNPGVLVFPQIRRRRRTGLARANQTDLDRGTGRLMD